MKLHFFVFKKNITEKFCLMHKEVEAEEKQKVYILDNPPSVQYAKRISKKDIGVCIPNYFDERVVLLEKDDKKAKDLFREYHAMMIAEEQRKIRIHNEAIDYIEKCEIMDNETD